MHQWNCLVDGVVEITPPLRSDDLEFAGKAIRQISINGRFSATEYDELGEWFSKHPETVLFVGWYKGETDLEFLRHFPSVTKFRMMTIDLVDASGLRFLSDRLTHLDLGGLVKGSIDLRPLERFQMLRELWIEKHTKHVDVLGKLRYLQKLSIRSCTLNNLEFLSSLPHLQWFEFKLGGTRNLDALRRLSRLKCLEMWMIRGLDDLSPIGDINSLNVLYLESQPRVTSLPNLSKLKRLRWMGIDKLKGLRDFHPVATAPELEDFFVDAPGLSPEDFRFLCEHPQLKRATVSLGSLKRDRIVDSFLRLPRVRVRPTFEELCGTPSH